MVSTWLSGFRARFPAVIRGRGQVYFDGRAVELRDVTEDRAVALVRGTEDYRVQIRDFARPAGAELRCSCPYFEDTGPCKHLWATLLALDEILEGIAATAAELGAEPAVAPVAPKRTRVPAEPAPPSWRERLQPLVPAPGDAAAGLWIGYFLDFHVVAAVAGDAGFEIHAFQRPIRADGRLGPWSQGEVSAETLERLAPADRALLRQLREQQRDDPWLPKARQARRGGVVLAEPWYVPNAALDTVLAQLAATERVFRWPPPDGDEPPTPITVDVAESFRLHIEPRRRGEVVQLEAMFVRGQEALTIAAVPAAGERALRLVENRLLRVDALGAGELAREFQHRGPMPVPPGELPEVLVTLARLPGAEQFLGGAIAALPLGEPIGQVAFDLPKDRDTAVPVRLRFEYAGTTVEAKDPSRLVAGGTGAVRRAPAAEAALRTAALAAGLQDGPPDLRCSREQVPAVVGALTAAGFRVFAAGKLLRPFQAGFGKARLASDWFQVDAEVAFQGHTAGLPELLRGLVTPDGFLELGDGTFGMLPAAWVERLDELRELGGELAGAAYRVPKERLLWLDALLDRQAGTFEVDARLGALRARLAAFQRLQEVQEPSGFRGELRPYQRHGLAWLGFLREAGLGGCLADDMGLGKTVQVLAHLLAHHADQRPRRPTLLVAPRSLVGNWLAEAARFAPGLSCLDFSAPDRWVRHGPALAKADLVVTTYALLRTDVPRFLERELRFGYGVLDEAHAAKNVDSQTSKAVRLIPADHRLALTGTPVENHLGELWALFEFLNPGLLGSLTKFRALFGRDLTDASRSAHRERVQRALRPVLLRRTKAQVLTELPPKVETTLWCDLEPAQRRRYDELRRHYQDQLLAGDGEGLDHAERGFVVLQALLRLRQAACHEGLLDRTRREAGSAKFTVLLEHLEELAAEGHKALVFSQFTSLLDLLEPQLQARGLAFERLDGSTRDRAARVRRFQEDAAVPVFLVSLKAGGTGLNLTAADYVFLLDPWWNPAAEMQAIDRAHRLGQRRTVHAYRIVCRGTVEERVLELQAGKRALCEAILGNERSLLQDLTRADLELLLG